MKFALLLAITAPLITVPKKIKNMQARSEALHLLDQLLIESDKSHILTDKKSKLLRARL